MESSHAAVGHNETTGTQDFVRVGAIQHVATLFIFPKSCLCFKHCSALNIILSCTVLMANANVLEQVIKILTHMD